MEKKVEYIDTDVSCACGANFKSKSTKEKINVEICSECHPFYTGTQKKVSKTGKVEKFKQKYQMKD